MSNENRTPAESNAAAIDDTTLRADEKPRNPDTELRVDGEDDNLYSDGLDIGDDSETLAGTDGDRPKGING